MKTVIIVDDEPVTRMDLSDMLADLGFSVKGEAADGFDAIELCRNVHPDIVLMDVRMPIFDGLTAAETILSEELSPCVVLLTAFSDTEVIRRAAEIGVTGYLVKPIDQKALLPTVEVAFSQSLRLQKARRETAEAKRKLQEDRQIHKAQQILARQQGISETEAYKQLRKAAMDKRLPVAVLAERILAQAGQHDDIAAVKALLIARKKLSDQKAYQYILSYAKVHGLTPEQGAGELKKQLLGEGR